MTYKRAALVWPLQGARRKEFRYIDKPRNPPRTSGRAYLFDFSFQTTMRNFNEIEKRILLIMIICEILLILILGIKINKGWDRSFKRKKY